MKRTVLTALVLLAGLALTGAETTPRVSVSSPKSELAFEKEQRDETRGLFHLVRFQPLHCRIRAVAVAHRSPVQTVRPHAPDPGSMGFNASDRPLPEIHAIVPESVQNR